MDIYKELNLSPVQNEPDVWLSRLVIFEKIFPEPIVIRDIPFTKGLNIIWAEETEGDISSAEITGHSAGKTTCCRFIRHILGEKTYGTQGNMDLIKNSLPNGYVAAEIHVRAQKLAVIRPIGNNRRSYIKADSSIEELLQDRSHPANLETYSQEIGLEHILDDFGTAGIVRTGEAIEWEHILSWCTRDQEARFQNIYDWRSPRSESKTPGFRFPKAGPLFVMRTALGLFLPDELKGEEKLANLLQYQEDLEKKIETLKQEPQFRINLYDSELRKHLQNVLTGQQEIETLPFHSDNLLPDLKSLTTNATDKIEGQIEELENNRKTLQGKIDDIGAKIHFNENRLMSLDNLFDLEKAAGKELDAGLLARQKNRQLIDKYSEIQCDLGDILYRNCQYVQNRQQVLQFKELQDAQAFEQAEAKREEAQQHFELQKQDINKEINSLIQLRQSLQTKRDAMLAGIREKSDELLDLKQSFENIQTWTKNRDQIGSNEKLDEYRKELTNTATLIQELEQQLTKLLSEHDENRKLLELIFSGAVRTVLSSGTYDGQVSLDNRELGFSVTHGTAMSGEAVETLSVLLSDIASLIYNTVSQSAHLPGFLLHDSPREADLGIRIYRSFIRFTASLQEHFETLDNCPFQYILTTTTPPPQELQNEKYVKLQLNAAETSGLLLKRNIEGETDIGDDPKLFSQ